jgi:signal transduction histidine kinase
VHHAAFGYLQNIGFENIYFSQLDFVELETFIIHIIFAGVIFFICGLWAYQLKKYNEIQILQTVQMARLHKEALLSNERKLNQEALEKANSELRKTNQELDRFVYSVSHDLRSPLTSMLGLIEISEDEIEDQFIIRNFEMLKTSINKLDSFIGDIINYSRNSRQEIMKQEIDFEEMLAEVRSNMKYLNKHKRMIEISLEITNDNAFVSDRQRLSIVLNNLVSNAIRYQDLQTPDPAVNVTIDTRENETSILIKDNGVGIKKEFHEKIFNMFYRVSRNSEGSGLGLYIVKETVEKLKGRIEVESEPGVGTAFKIHIPNLASQGNIHETFMNDQMVLSQPIEKTI